MWVVGTILIVLATMGLGVVIDRKLRPRAVGAPKRELLHAPGAAPATAIASAALRPPRCCIAMTETGRETVHYDERELLVVRFACPRCATMRSIYVVTP